MFRYAKAQVAESKISVVARLVTSMRSNIAWYAGNLSSKGTGADPINTAFGERRSRMFPESTQQVRD